MKMNAVRHSMISKSVIYIYSIWTTTPINEPKKKQWKQEVKNNSYIIIKYRDTYKTKTHKLCNQNLINSIKKYLYTIYFQHEMRKNEEKKQKQNLQFMIRANLLNIFWTYPLYYIRIEFIIYFITVCVIAANEISSPILHVHDSFVVCIVNSPPPLNELYSYPPNDELPLHSSLFEYFLSVEFSRVFFLSLFHLFVW